MPFVKGYKWTTEQRECCGFKKGIFPWNKNKTNIYSIDTLNLMSLAKKGKPSFFKGKQHSLESIVKLRESLKNHPNRRGPKDKPWSLARIIAQEKRNGLPYKRMNKPKSIKPLTMRGKEYPFNWSELRKQIYKRDGWICQECGVHCQDKQTKKIRIQCHHIDYNTTNNVFSNLITLCASCHAKTLYKREDWIKYYKNIIGVRGLIISEN